MDIEKKMIPDCYQCKYRRDLVFDSHSECKNWGARVVGKAWGIEHGWFFWPFNFDPIWLVECDGFAAISEVKGKNEEVTRGTVLGKG